jgi:hypothetical protein
MTFLLGCAENLGHSGGRFSPGVFFELELVAIVFGGAPASLDPAAAFGAVERRVEGALLNAERVAGAVLGFEGEGLHDVRSALGEFDVVGGHGGFPFRFYRKGTRSLVEVQGVDWRGSIGGAGGEGPGGMPHAPLLLIAGRHAARADFDGPVNYNPKARIPSAGGFAIW